MIAEIIAVGSELLTPYRTDTNSLFLTGALNGLGVDVVYKTIVGDDRVRLAETLGMALRRSDLIVTIGGLGPTEDDLTRECVAAVLRRCSREDTRILETLRERFRQRGMQMPVINARQAQVIDGATVLQNPKGTAPGQWLEEDGKILILLPGPPRELEPLFEQTCVPLLRQRVPPAFIRTRVLRLTGMTESAVDERIAPVYTRYDNPVTTILATLGEIQVHLKSVGRTEAEAEGYLNDLSPRLEELLGNYIFSGNGQSLEQVVGELLQSRSATMAVAESCTGGLLAERITGVSGSSAYFLGGVVCYSNALKTEFLGVPENELALYGAVSGEVAQALAQGIRLRTGSTLGVGVTGIAGPTGGSLEKPVGLVYLGVAGCGETQVLERRFSGERETIRWQASQAALDMMRRRLMDGQT